jgi:galactose mutarotase-like enzyme
MEYTIASDRLEVTISETGAELYSIKLNGEERLWQADPAIWGKHAPVLFPFIARLRDGYYELDGQRIDIPIHGFCRTRPFKGAKTSATAAIFATEYDDETYACYPFRFKLEIEYEVEGSMLIKTHRITNLGNELMPFEIGGHEAYATSNFVGGWHVQFEGIESIEPYGMDESGTLSLPKWQLDLPKGRLSATPENLGIDTIMVENVPNSRVTLAENDGNRAVIVEFADFPYLGIWTMAGKGETGYLCVEPWSTLPDGHFMPRDVFGKTGICVAEPGETRVLSYAMTFR